MHPTRAISLLALAVLPASTAARELVTQRYTRPTCLGFVDSIYNGLSDVDTCLPFTAPATYLRFTFFGDLPSIQSLCSL